ncbi:MAG: type II secretion system F family protein [Nitrososphaerales archaeon]
MPGVYSISCAGLGKASRIFSPPSKSDILFEFDDNELVIEQELHFWNIRQSEKSGSAKQERRKKLARLVPQFRREKKEARPGIKEPKDKKKRKIRSLFSKKDKEQENKEAHVKSLNPIERFAYSKISGRLPAIRGYREIYEQAGMPLIYESYFATSILISAIVTLPAFMISLLIEIRLLHVSVFISLLGSLVLAGIVFAISLGLWLIYPLQRRKSFKTKLENRLAYSFGILGVLAASGMGIERLFEKLIPTESNSVIADLASRLIRNITVFGLDTETALKETAQHTPSPAFASMLESMAIAFKTTGSVSDLILYESGRLFQEKRDKLKKIIGNLGLLAEMYITLVVVGPIIFIVMMSIFGLLPSGGLPDPILLINIIVFIGVPVIAVVFLLILDSTVSNV